MIKGYRRNTYSSARRSTGNYLNSRPQTDSLADVFFADFIRRPLMGYDATGHTDRPPKRRCLSVPVRRKGSIFISYRRKEAAAEAGRLAAELPRDGYPMFIDVVDIHVAVPWREKIKQAVNNCAVLLAVIGRDWLEMKDAQGRRRLDDPDDVMRVEIEAALKRDVPVIPVLIDDAKTPKSSDFPRAFGHWSIARPRSCGTTDSRYDYSISKTPLMSRSSHRPTPVPSPSSPDYCWSWPVQALRGQEGR